MKDNNITIEFARPCKDVTKQNLVKCGGLEMPIIVGGILKHFYFNNFGGKTSCLDCIQDLADNDVVGYGFDDLYETYYSKVATLLYSMFTGLKMAQPWNGRAEVNGGYVVVKSDGDVVAYHSSITDEFKDFLVHKLDLEAPSHKRHKDMIIEKIDGKYYLKLALQFRFSMKR
ncbi:MAG: HpaII family restriction endonuclease [Firmicutes bacterium]|nr:HpaII family restriction endonuclease [Bacillota bacterium]